MVSKLVRHTHDVEKDGVIDPIDGCANPPWGRTKSSRDAQTSVERELARRGVALA